MSAVDRRLRAQMRKRVVFFTPGVHEIGGAARRSRLLAAGLSERGWEVRLVARSATTHRFRLERDDGVSIFEVPGFGRRRVGATLYLACAIPCGLIWGRAATAFLAIQLVSPALAAGSCSFLLGRPYLAFTSTTGELSEVLAVTKARTASFRRLMLRRARFLVSQTPEAARELAQLTAPDRISVLPTPVRCGFPAPLNGEPRVVFTGRLSQEKNLLRLLDAWRSVVSLIPDAVLTLVGEGGAYRPVEDELRRIVAADSLLAGSVRFTGWVDEVSRYLRESDVFVLPSVTEGMSNALLEASALGRVVVTSDIPGNRAVVGPGYPLLFRAHDTEALTSALHTALADSAVRQAAIEHLESRMVQFDLDTVSRKLEEMIADAAKGAPRQTRRGG